jgi:hypothetical protein
MIVSSSAGATDFELSAKADGEEVDDVEDTEDDDAASADAFSVTTGAVDVGDGGCNHFFPPSTTEEDIPLALPSEVSHPSSRLSTLVSAMLATLVPSVAEWLLPATLSSLGPRLNDEDS